MGRGALCLRRTERECAGERSRDHRVLPRPAARLQDTEGRGVRSYPQDINRQDPEVHAAQSGQFGQGNLGLWALPLKDQGCKIRMLSRRELVGSPLAVGVVLASQEVLAQSAKRIIVDAQVRLWKAESEDWK